MDAITIYLEMSSLTMVQVTMQRESLEQDPIHALAYQIIHHAFGMTARIISNQARLVGHFLASNLSSQQK